jgi:hypothetical protein
VEEEEQKYSKWWFSRDAENGEKKINPLNAKLNSICHLLALLGAHHILHFSRIRVKGLKFFVTNRRL